MSVTQTNGGLTLAVLGCACVSSIESAQRLENQFSDHTGSLTVFHGRNLDAVRASDIILLSCETKKVTEVLAEENMRLALEGKLLLNICAGISAQQLENIIYGPAAGSEDGANTRCFIVHAQPNTASRIRQSTTIISTPASPLPQELFDLTNWVFQCIGTVIYVPLNAMDSATVLCGATPAVLSLLLEGMVDAGVEKGLNRTQAISILAHSMRGTADLLINGQDPASVIESVTTPGGITAKGLSVLHNAQVGETIADAFTQAITMVGQVKGIIAKQNQQILDQKQ
ncbi:delta 1-pyrroline-5-carboxylate reductase [Schaereria dolodes]|nr:delta 1-pyrroline-5-carboxylate reductase [Schaereria dolodes]